MKMLKKAVALLCAAACTFSIAGTFSLANETSAITPIQGSSLYVDRDGQNAYLCGIPVGSTADGVQSMLEGDCVFAKSGTLSTGDKVTLYADGAAAESAYVVIKGDVNGDGTVNAKDVVNMKKKLSDNALDELSEKACDANADGVFDEDDLNALSNFVIAEPVSATAMGTLEKSEYYEGEEFSPKGIYLNVSYSDGTTISYADGLTCEYGRGDGLCLEDEYVTVSFDGVSGTVAVTVLETVTFDARITVGQADCVLGVEGDNVELEYFSLGQDQRWRFTRQSDETYEIKHISSGLLLTADAAQEQANVGVSADADAATQRWSLEKASNGAYTIRSAAGAFVLDVFSAKLTDGSNVWLYTSNGTEAQAFDIRYISALEESALNDHLDIGDDIIASIKGVTSGKNLQVTSDDVLLKTKDNISSQLWRFARQSDGSYAVISQTSGKQLDVMGRKTNATSNAQVYKDVSSASQRWYVLQGDSGYIFVPKCSDVCVLEIKDSGTSDGVNIQTGEYSGKASSQQFALDIITQDYVSYVEPANIGSHFNATIKVGSKLVAISNSNAIVYSASEGADQVWRFERQSDGGYVLINNRFEQALDVAGASSADGTNVQIYTANGTAAQKWFVYEKEGKYILRSALANDAVLDAHEGAGTNLNNISLWELSYSDTQLFTIDKDNMSAMSFNIYCAKLTTDRMNRVITMMSKYTPDTIGIQEATLQWINYLNSNLGSKYAIVGCGRDGGTSGEYSAIMYNKHVFNLVDSGTRWLSDTPLSVSKYSESLYNRIMTYALLERKDNGERMLVINTHLDYPTNSTALRVKQYNVIQSFINSYTDYPTIITGDFNDQPGSSVYNTVTSNGFYDSAKNAAVRYEASTFTNFGAASQTLDYAFFSANDYDLRYYKVCNEMINGDYPSDHHPVYVRYALK